MEIQHKDNNKTGVFFIEENGEKLAELVYSWNGNDRIIIEHTEVNDVLRGKNIGKTLVATLVEFAREKGIKIVPVCLFAKNVLDKNKEYQDVL